MKTRGMLLAIPMVVMGLLLSQATAGPLLKVQVELAAGQSGVLSPTEPNVLLNVWAYVAGQNDSTSDDGVMMLSGALRSGAGGLRGDLSFALNASGAASDGQEHGGFTAFPSNAGTSQDLDGDGDLDIGGKDGNLSNSTWGYWIWPNSGVPYYMPCSDGNRVLLGTAIFTLTDPDPLSDPSTTINWSFRVKTGLGSFIDAFSVDGCLYDLKGDSNQIGTGPDAMVTWGEELTIAYVLPEPGTMALLASGGLVMLSRRKRTRGPISS